MKAKLMSAAKKSNRTSPPLFKSTSKNDLIASIALRIAALLAFLAINLIGFRAFSAEADIQSTLEEQIKTVQGRVEAAIPSCQLASEGLVENKWKNVRIQIGGAIIAGAESLNDLSDTLKQLVVEHRCIPLAVPCSFASEGLALGSWVKHRVMVQDGVAFGGNNTNRLFEQIGELKKIGVCQ